MAYNNLLPLLKTCSLWIVLSLVLIAELVVRISIPAGKLPRGAFHSSEFRQQVERFSTAMPVDMLIVGSSVAAVNYPPVPLDNQLREAGMTGFTTYNAGIRGCNYQCIDIGIRRHYLTQDIPAIAVLVVGPADLNIDNGGVVERSHRFMADMQRSVVARTARQWLSSVSYLYGFKEHVRSWLSSGEWDFDPATQGERGYIDMGSDQRTRSTQVSRISHDSDITLSLVSLVDRLTSVGTRVILLPVIGDSLARLLYTDEARIQFDEVIDSLEESPEVFVLEKNTSDYGDDDYIDSSHLNSETAIVNSKRLAQILIQSGLLAEKF